MINDPHTQQVTIRFVAETPNVNNTPASSARTQLCCPTAIATNVNLTLAQLREQTKQMAILIKHHCNRCICSRHRRSILRVTDASLGSALLRML